MNLAFSQHDHRACIDTALRTARSVCDQHGARLTPLREQVLRLVWQSHKPLGAYAILEQLGDDATAGGKRRLGPPTVYRALEFLRDLRLVHRINSLNAFIGCPHPQAQHATCFLICRNCESAVELNADALDIAVHSVAAAARFSDEDASIEITGLCPSCRNVPGLPQ